MEKILKIFTTLGKFENTILHGLTHPTANRLKQTLAKTPEQTFSTKSQTSQNL